MSNAAASSMPPAAVTLDLTRSRHLVVRHRRRRDADHRHVERAGLHHRVERGEDLLPREVAGEPEDDERVGDGRLGVAMTSLTACLPAGRLDVTAELLPHGRQHLIGKDALAARSEKRSYTRRAENVRRDGFVDGRLRCVQRPSPESATLPPNLPRGSGPSCSAPGGQVEQPRTRPRCRGAPELRDLRQGPCRTGRTRDGAAVPSRRRRRGDRACRRWHCAGCSGPLRMRP